MATHMLDRSTYWVNGGGVDNPVATGDYRYWWSIYYETDKTNRKTKFTVDYYLQYHFTDYGEDDPYSFIVPSGTSTVYINGGSIGSVKTSTKTIEKGMNKVRVYIGQETFSINHSNDGSASFTFQGFGFGIGTSPSEYSTPKNFPSIPSQSKLGEIKTFDIDSGISSIGVTKYVDGYYDVLQISNGSNVFKTINGFKNGDPVTFTETELDNIYAKIPTGDKATFTFKLTTYTNSSKTTSIGTDTKTATGNFTIILPTVKGAVCTDNIKNMPNWTGDSTNQTIVRDISHIIVTIPTSMHAVANTRGATIKEYVIEDKHVDYNASGSSVNLWTEDGEGHPDPESANVYNNKDYVTIYAVDSRETSSLPFIQKFEKYVPYEHVSFNTKTASIVRDNGGVGRQVTLSIEGTWWNGNFGAVQNALEFEVYYRNAEDGYWNSFDEFLEGASIGQIDTSLIDLSETGKFKYNGPVMSTENDKGFDVKYPYDIVMVVYDEIDNRGFYITVEYGEPAIAVYKNKAALGGPYDESLGGTQLWGDIYVNGEPHSIGSEINAAIQRHIVSAYLNTDQSFSMISWTSEQVNFDSAVVVGDKLQFQDGIVKIGEGVKYVKVSASAYFIGSTPAGQIRAWYQIMDTNGKERYGVPAFMYKSNNDANTMLVIPTRTLEVTEGEGVRLIVQIGNTADISLIQRGTTLDVEVVG